MKASKQERVRRMPLAGLVVALVIWAPSLTGQAQESQVQPGGKGPPAVRPAGVPGVTTEVEPQPGRKARPETKAFMRVKLAWSDGVLEGLTLEKFDQVSRNALRLRDLTHSNLWYSMRQPDYLRQTTNFQQAAEAVYMAAVDKKLDLATDAYARMTRSCIECHRLVRVEQKRNAGGAGSRSEQPRSVIPAGKAID